MSDQRVDLNQRLRLGLVFGGRSGEHDVSVVSARSVASALDGDRYEVVPMAIDRRGLWADGETSDRVLRSSGDRTDAVIEFAGSNGLDPRLSDGSIHIAFPVLHGPYGEDGTIQGLFEMLDLPYVGCDHAASAVCMDKALTKRLLVQAGVPTVQWRELTVSQWREDRPRPEETVSRPRPPPVRQARAARFVGGDLPCHPALGFRPRSRAGVGAR